MMKVKQLVPKLRFREFDGEWKVIKLGDLAGKIGDGIHGTPVYSDDSDIHFINGNNLTNGKIEITEKTKKVDFSIFKKNDKGLNENSILISLNGTIGNISKYNNEKVMLGKSVGYFNFKEKTDFYFHVFHTDKIQNFFISELTGSTIKNLSLKTLRETIFPLPSLPEQQKIASFLSAVDEKIQQLTKKKELLEHYKKGVMQQLFSGKLRFKDADGKDYPEWEEKRLGEIMRIPNKLKPVNFDVNKLLSVKLHTKGLFQNTNTESLKLGATNYFVRKKGQFIYGKQNLFNGAFGIIPEKFDGFYSSGDIPALDFIPNKVIPEFVLFYISQKNYYEKLENIASGSGSKRIHEKTFLEIKITFPSLPEQQKIATYLSSIDTKIERVNQQITQTQTFKKGLLQQLFV